MKIACLQFSPQLGKPLQNIERANRLIENTPDLQTATDGSPLWLLLPEMAFSGYSFTSLAEITPYLEPQYTGRSTIWAQNIARKYKIYITVGYPETVPVSSDPNAPNVNFNSTVTVNPEGHIIGTYRKRFLYYTDETWAKEGDGKSFFHGNMGALGRVSMGICMDINPYKFLAPWTEYEFANHVLRAKTPLVVINMAWLTRLSTQELGELPLRPDEETFAYWIERFQPLLKATVPKEGQENTGPIVVVCANRCGIESDNTCFAGTSSVFLVERGKVSIFDVLGKCEEKCLVVDLTKPPKYALERGVS